MEDDGLDREERGEFDDDVGRENDEGRWERCCGRSGQSAEERGSVKID